MPRWMLGVMVGLLLIGWGLSLRHADADGLWYDEVWSVYNAGGPPDGPLSPAAIAQRLASEDPDQGLAYPLILAAWSAGVGWTPFAGRALSGLVGLLTAALVARLGRRLFQASAGLAAATILLLSPFFIYYMHELRVFTIVALSVMALVWLYMDLMTPRRAQKTPASRLITRVGFVIAGLGLLYTHYFAATMLVALGVMHGLWLLIKLLDLRRAPSAPQTQAEWRDFVRRWGRVSALLGLTGLLFVPWLPVFAQSLQRTATREDVHAKALTAPALIEHVAYYLGAGVPLLTAALLLMGVWAAWRRGGWSRWMAGMALVAWGVVIGFNAALQIIEPGRVRYLIVLWPLLTLVMGVGAAWFADAIAQGTPKTGSGRLRSYAAACVIGGLALNGVRANVDANALNRMEQKWTPPWQQMTRLIGQHGGPQDMFVFYAGEDHARHFYPFTFVTRGLPLAAPAVISEVLADPTYGAGIQAQLEGAGRVWYGVDKNQQARPAVAMMQDNLRSMLLCDTFIDTPRFSFTLYARDAAFCPQPPQISYGDPLALIGFSLQGDQTELLTVNLLWQVDAGISDVTSVSMQVLADDGPPVAQRDVGLPDGPYGITREVLDLRDVAPGDYRVALIVYRWQSGERLPGTWLNSGDTGEVLDIGRMTRP